MTCLSLLTATLYPLAEGWGPTGRVRGFLAVAC